MIWNLEINDPNLRFLLEKERDKAILQQSLRVQFEAAIQNITDDRTRQLVVENSDLFRDAKSLQDFKEQLCYCQELHEAVNQLKELVSLQQGLARLTSSMREIIRKPCNFKSEQILKYHQSKLEVVSNAIQEFERQIISLLSDFGYPNKVGKSNDQKLFAEVTQFVMIARQFNPKFISSMMREILLTAEFHFLEEGNMTSAINHSEWMFSYLRENMEKFMKNLLLIDKNYESSDPYLNAELDTHVESLVQVLISDYVLVLLEKRLNRDCARLKENPNLILSFVEATDSFQINLQHFREGKFVRSFEGIFEFVIDWLMKNGLFEDLLTWEKQLFEQSIFSEYRERIKERDIQLFLNLVEEFQIVWNSLKGKYRQLRKQEALSEVQKVNSRIFEEFLRLCNEYHSITASLSEKDANYVQFLQTYYIGFEQVRNTFAEYQEEIKKIYRRTVKKQLEGLVSRTGERIYKRLVLEIIQMFDYFEKINGVTLYQNHQIYFVQHGSDQSKQINNYYYLANVGVSKILNENIISKKFCPSLNSLICKSIAKVVYNLMIQSAQKIKFSKDGLLIYVMILMRTITFLIYQCGNLDVQRVVKRFDEIFNLVNKRDPQKECAHLKEVDKYFIDSIQF